MGSYSYGFQVRCSVHKPSISHPLDHFKSSLSSSLKPLLRELQEVPLRIDVIERLKTVSVKLVDAFVDSVFEFDDQTLLPSQINFAPVEEIGGVVSLTKIEGRIPDDFPEGVYVRNGPNPLFGGLKSTKSMFGRSSHAWIEGEGMIHAIYVKKNHDGNTKICYNNKHVQTETYKIERQRNKPSFLPAIEGDPPAVLSAFLLNLLRFGKVNKYLSNTNVIEHSGKFYSTAESHMPHEIDINTLDTLGNWDVNGAWDRSFTSHPKKAPGTGELVIMGVYAVQPYFQLGVISADGMKLVHKVDLKFKRCSLSHDMGVTQRYNIIMDFPLTIDIDRLVKGGPLIKYSKEEYARIGVMPRYGDANSVKWFDVETSISFHIFNSFEEGDEVVIWACRARGSIIPGPDLGHNKYEWFSRGFKKPPISNQEQDDISSQDGQLFSHAYEWRLNMHTGHVEERNLTGIDNSMEFPMINENFRGVRNRFGYAQVSDSIASSTAGMSKFGGLVKLYFEEHEEDSSSKSSEKFVKEEYHMFEPNTFCSGASFVPKDEVKEEDDGWIITFVHNEDTCISYVYIIDTRKFSSEPVARIVVPTRVPYGFHGAFMPTPPKH